MREPLQESAEPVSFLDDKRWGFSPFCEETLLCIITRLVASNPFDFRVSRLMGNGLI